MLKGAILLSSDSVGLIDNDGRITIVPQTTPTTIALLTPHFLVVAGTDK